MRRAAQRVSNRIRSWSTAAVLAADEPADSRLETIEVEFAPGGSDEADEFEHYSSPATGILEELGVDLAQRGGGRIDRRDELVRRVLEILAASDRSSVMLVGPPDVGKTALVHEVARRHRGGRRSAPL